MVLRWKLVGMSAAAGYLAKQSPVTLAIAGGVVLVLGYLVVKEVAKAGAGLVSGNNAITRNQTNAAGEKVTAYEGAGVLGTVGAATNSASGGVLASVGEWIGGKVADWTLPDPMATPAPAAKAPGVDTAGYGTGGWW